MSVNRSTLYVGLMLLAAAAAGYMISLKLARGAPQLLSGTALPAPRAVTRFALSDHLGASFGNAELAGRPSLIFFGFTHCPDVCPTTLALMSQLQRDARLANLRMLFITVDPRRDDQQTMQRYVAAFGGNLVGLRGTDVALDPLLTNLGAARRVEARAGGDYSVDHSATLYYINARGALSAVFTPPFDFARLQGDLVALLASHY